MARTMKLSDPRGKLSPLETPCFVSPTEMGMIPCVTPDISPPTPLYFSLGDFCDWNKPISPLGICEKWLFLGAGTNFNNFDEGPSDKSVKIYARNGSLRNVTVEDYQKVVDSLSPQAVISLYSPVLPESTTRQKKLRINITEKSVRNYTNCINFVHESANDDSDNNCLFFQFGEVTSDDEKLIENKIKNKPKELPRMVLCDGHPSDVRKLYQLGLDIFVLNFPFIAAKKGIALNFDFSQKEFKKIGIDLKSNAFERDYTPICDDCDCPCCQQFTKSYIYHLLEVHEMLAATLLVQHNIRHYQRYLEALANELAKD